ncbi:MAG TPA: OmpA family protein [Burkholderiales bacterium]|nr:OmpA family protein [Burkholderiales bacterium]
MVFLAPDRVGNELVVVVPSADGHVGVVIVERGDKKLTLDTAFAASRIVDGGAPAAERFGGADAVRAEFADVLAALPDRPQSFLVYFLEGTDEFTEESGIEFTKILSELRERSAPDVVVIGHTDRVGNVQYNDDLSLQRAERVRGELVRLGIPPARIRVAGRGEREPLVATDDDVAEPRNRRVEINVR